MNEEIYACENCTDIFVSDQLGIPQCPRCKAIAKTWQHSEVT